jgi:myo-inositol 2-dehydrogenase / D-chiro-inositol 1-dehydrogenase
MRKHVTRIGLIGCGNVAVKRHLPVLTALPEAEVVAVADTSPSQINLVGKKFHIKKAYGHYFDLLADSNVDAVAVCVPLEFHFEIALAALDAGKHVLIEKPLVSTLEEADHLIDRAVKTGKKAMIGFNKRWHYRINQVRETIEKGLLGPVSVINCVYTTGHTKDALPEWRAKREKGGGSLIENGVHLYDLWRFLLQKDIVEVFASSQSGEDCDDEFCVVTARTSDGVLLNAVLSDLLPTRHDMTILGRDCALSLSLDRFDGYELTPLGTCAGDIGNRLRNAQFFIKELPHAIRQVRGEGQYNASFKAQWKHFIDCIQRDVKVACTLEDGRHALKVALAAAKSAVVEHFVKVHEAPETIMPVAYNQGLVTESF